MAGRSYGAKYWADKAHPDLSLEQHSVLKAIARQADWSTGEHCSARVETLAKLGKVSVRTVQRAINEVLEPLGYIKPGDPSLAQQTENGPTRVWDVNWQGTQLPPPPKAKKAVSYKSNPKWDPYHPAFDPDSLPDGHPLNEVYWEEALCGKCGANPVSPAHDCPISDEEADAMWTRVEPASDEDDEGRSDESAARPAPAANRYAWDDSMDPFDAQFGAQPQ